MSVNQFPTRNDYLAIMPKNQLFKRLTESSIHYVAKMALGEGRAVVEFAGQFQGRPVIWQATIIALNAVLNAEQDSQPSQSAVQYIDVIENQSPEDELLQVEIGLFVTQVDEPTVIKVITMMRQYKNLRQGRHEFSGARK